MMDVINTYGYGSRIFSMSEIQTCLDAKTIFNVTLYDLIATIYIYMSYRGVVRTGFWSDER